MTRTMGDIPFPMSKRKKVILKAFWSLAKGLDKEVTTRAIAEKAKLNVNGVAQTLGVMPFTVYCTGGKGGDRTWRFKKLYSSSSLNPATAGSLFFINMWYHNTTFTDNGRSNNH